MKTNRYLWAVIVAVAAGVAMSCAWAQDDEYDPGAVEQPVDEAAPEDNAVGDEQVQPPPPPEAGGSEEPGAQVPQEPGEEAVPVEEEEPAQLPSPMPQRPTRPLRPQPGRPRPLLPLRGAGSSEPSGAKTTPASTAGINDGPKDGRVPESPVTFDFDNVPLNNVISAIARMTGKNFDVDPNIASVPVTVITHDQIPPSLAYQVLESILSSRGFSLVETLDGHLIKVVKSGDSREKMPFDVSTKTPPDRYDTWSTHVVGVKNADASELATILQQLGSSSATVDAYAPTNTLIITDNADGLRRIFAFLEEVDIPGFDTKMEIFTLEYTRAETLSTQIEQVLSPEGATRSAQGQTAGSPTRTTRPVRPTRPTVPGTTGPLVIGARQEILRIVPDERLNALIVVATEGMMERVRDLVDKLDTPTPYEANNLNVYELLNAKAEEVESALNALVGTTPRQAGAAGAGGGGAAPAEIQPFEKKVVITRYEQTNALLILASPQDYKLIKEIIAQLDVPTRQVHLEAVILEVSVNDNFTLNVETTAFQKDTHGVVALNNVVNLANMLTKGPLAVAGAGLTTGYMDGTTTITVAGADGTLTPTIIPNVPLLITALENMTDLDVLSQPVLTTKDNESANIVVGQEVPVPTTRSGYSYSSNTDRSSSTYTGLTTSGRGITREDVGVKMTVTPHINEGDYITTEIEIEVSQPIVSDVGIDSNELGPTFQKAQIKNNVVVRDGDTAIVGGLISESTDHSRRQLPIMGDVPILGWLFRSRGATRNKHNLVVLLTPHIIREGGDLERLTEYRMGEFREANVDVLFEKGFIRKIKTRNYMRSKYRPGTERSKQYESGAGFKRGDVAR